MRKRLEEIGVYGECFSRGLLALPGRKVPEQALRIAGEFGVDLSPHVSQPLLVPDLDRATVVMVMEPDQRQHISKMHPACIGKVFMLSQPGGGAAIEDPIGRSDEIYRRVYQEIADFVDAWIERFGAG